MQKEYSIISYRPIRWNSGKHGKPNDTPITVETAEEIGGITSKTGETTTETGETKEKTGETTAEFRRNRETKNCRY